ncbi:MAG: DMT family transporter [Rhodospirillales bacterium]
MEAGLVVAWSSGYIGARMAADTASVLLVLFWRFVLVTLLLSPFVMLAARRGLSWSAVGHHALVGALAMFGFLVLGVLAIDLGVATGTAALIAALQPLMTAALVGPVLGQRVVARQWLGLAVGLGGILLAVGGAWGQAPPLAYLLSLASTACLVAATLLAKARPDSTALLPALAIQSATTMLLILPLLWLVEGTLRPPAEAGFHYAVVWFVVFSTFGGYGFYWLCLKRSSATRVGALIYLTPPVTMIWAWALFAEALSLAALGGFAFCLLGVALARDPKPANQAVI